MLLETMVITTRPGFIKFTNSVADAYISHFKTRLNSKSHQKAAEKSEAEVIVLCKEWEELKAKASDIPPYESYRSEIEKEANKLQNDAYWAVRTVRLDKIKDLLQAEIYLIRSGMGIKELERPKLIIKNDNKIARKTTIMSVFNRLKSPGGVAETVDILKKRHAEGSAEWRKLVSGNRESE